MVPIKNENIWEVIFKTLIRVPFAQVPFPKAPALDTGGTEVD